jgi:YD repeat-containing protein
MVNDALSRIIQNTDPASNKNNFAYDNDGNITQVKDALSNTTSISYQTGRGVRLVAMVTDANNHATSFSYDVLGRVTSARNALGHSASMHYDAKGRPISVTTRNGQTIGMSYDNLDRLIQLSPPEGNISVGYDAVGNKVSLANYNGSMLARTYDVLNRPTQITQTLPNGYSVPLGQAFDANGNRTSLSTPWGNFNYTYDALNRMTSITNPYGQITGFVYDALGRPTVENLPNGTKTTYAYDAGSQVTQVMHQNTVTQGAIAFANYAYDIDGNRTSMSDLNGTHTFSYDKLNRLTAANHPASSNLPVLAETFSFDPTGNRTNDALRATYVYNAANQLVSDSSFTYTVDANGNTTSRTSIASGQTTTFMYDSANRLIGANTPSNTLGAYKYDAEGRRVERTVYRAPGNSDHVLR